MVYPFDKMFKKALFTGGLFLNSNRSHPVLPAVEQEWWIDGLVKIWANEVV